MSLLNRTLVAPSCDGGAFRVARLADNISISRSGARQLSACLDLPGSGKLAPLGFWSAWVAIDLDLGATIPLVVIAFGTLIQPRIERLLGIRSDLSAYGALEGNAVVAIVTSGLAFGLAHFIQGPLGIVTRGMVGLVFAWAWFNSDRNLWALILALRSSTATASQCSTLAFMAEIPPAVCPAASSSGDADEAVHPLADDSTRSDWRNVAASQRGQVVIRRHRPRASNRDYMDVTL